MNIRRNVVLLTMLPGLLFAPLAGGEPLQGHDGIRAAAETFITGVVVSSHGKQPEVKAGALDSRLRLARCDAPLAGFQPSGARMLGNTTVGVRCTGSSPWTLYVPVRVSLFGDVVVAARPLARGTHLTGADLKLANRDLARLHSGYFSDISQLVGKEISRNAAVDAALTTALVKEPVAVRRGQQVSLVASAGGLEVRMIGEAMEDGTAGKRIKVRNRSSKRIIDGVVRADATVHISL